MRRSGLRRPRPLLPGRWFQVYTNPLHVALVVVLRVPGKTQSAFQIAVEESQNRIQFKESVLDLEAWQSPEFRSPANPSHFSIRDQDALASGPGEVCAEFSGRAA